MLRDLDLIKKINEKEWACVIFSIVKTSSNGFGEAFEPYAPKIEGRFKALKSIASSGVLTGIAFMPILPFICDDDENLANVVKMTEEHGGRFVLAAGLTLSGSQKIHYLQAVAKYDSDLEFKYQSLYEGEHNPVYQEYSNRIGKKVRQLCDKYGLADRMPRHIVRGELASNKKIAERLFNRIYQMELDGENRYKIWAYRKAAWSIDEAEEDVRELYNRKGSKGLQDIQNIGGTIAKEVGKEIQELSD